MSKDDVNTTEGASENAEAQEGTLAEQQVLRVNVTLPDSIVIPLNHIGLEDNAEYLRSLLQEYRESAHLTSYHFEVASSKVCVNEFADLAVYLPEDAEELVLELALVLDNYTVKRIREQVNRVKEMIKFPLMTLNSVEATSSNKADTDAEAGEIAVENKDSNSKNKNKKDVKEKEVSIDLYFRGRKISLYAYVIVMVIIFPFLLSGALETQPWSSSMFCYNNNIIACNHHTNIIHQNQTFSFLSIYQHYLFIGGGGSG